MMPTPLEPFERELWDVHERLTYARNLGRGIGVADDVAKEKVRAFVESTPEHVDALASFLRHLAAEVEYLARRIAELESLRAEAESDARRFRSHALHALIARGAKSVSGRQSMLMAPRATKKVVIECPIAQLPLPFTRTHPVRIEPDVPKIREALERGEKIQYCSLADDGFRLVVR
jgi:Siphovirus Gp157